MTTWLPRALVFAFVMIVVRLVQGAMIDTWETQAGVISIFLMAVYSVAAFALGFIDGTGDAKAQPDPDRRADLAMMWLVAGLAAGAISGAVCWFISLFYKSLYVGGLINELTTFAAFTALLTFIMALVGVTIGRWLVDRRAPEVPKLVGTEENTDTDVFAAVGGGQAQTAATEAQADASGTATDVIDQPKGPDAK